MWQCKFCGDVMKDNAAAHCGRVPAAVWFDDDGLDPPHTEYEDEQFEQMPHETR